MANPAREHEALLRRHRFVLISENKHRKYKDPEGRVYIVSKTPSDWRAWQNAVSTLKRVIANLVPSSELLEEERQRRALEEFIQLEAQRKPSVVGISGAGKGKKSRGTGFIYDRKDEKSKEQLAHEQRMAAVMSTPEWQARNAGRRAHEQQRINERKARRALRRVAGEWNYRLNRFKSQSQQVEDDCTTIKRFLGATILVQAARRHCAQKLREWAKPVDSHERQLGFNEAFRLAYQNIEYEQLKKLVDQEAALGMFIYGLSGRAPQWFQPEWSTDNSMTLTAPQMRLLGLTAEFLTNKRIELVDGHIRNPQTVPQWLYDALMKIHVGENHINGMGDWNATPEKEKAA